MEFDPFLQRALPKTRNDNPPMRESSNASTCQPIPVALANGQYVDRFGCLRAIDIVDLTQVCSFIFMGGTSLIFGYTSADRGP